MNISCDLCGSEDIAETRSRYVCRNCAVELTHQKIVFSANPYRSPNHGPLYHFTQWDLKDVQYDRDWTRRLKINNFTADNKKDIKELNYAKGEIRRFMNYLFLNPTERTIEKRFEKFKRLRSKFKSGTKLLGPDILVPICIWSYIRTNAIFWEGLREDFLSLIRGDLDKYKTKERDFIKTNEEYQQRDRKEIVRNMLLALRDHFEQLDMAFYYRAKKIGNSLWNAICGTKEKNIAGIITFITVSCYRYDLKVSDICKFLGLNNLQATIKRTIFDQFHIPGFSTLVRSSDILKEWFIKAGIIEIIGQEGVEAKDDIIEKEPEIDSLPEIIEITLGGTDQVSNHLHETSQHSYAIRLNTKDINIISINLFEPSSLIKRSRLSFLWKPLRFWRRTSSKICIELDMYKFSAKDPP